MESQHPSITLAMPTGRSPQAVVHTIFSALNQTLTPLKMVVYDASMSGWDNLHNDVSGWLLTRMNVHVHRGNPGDLPQVGRNWIYNNSDTEWIFLLDDDVLCHYDTLQEMWNTHLRTGAKVIAGTKLETVGVEAPYNFRAWFKTRFDRNYDTVSPVADTGCMLIHRSAWNLGKSDYSGIGEDLYWTAQIGVRTPIVISAKGRTLHLRSRMGDAAANAWDGKNSRMWVNVNEQWLVTKLKPLLSEPEWDRLIDSLQVDREKLIQEEENLSTHSDAYSFTQRLQAGL